jgi:hypothetical protein
LEDIAPSFQFVSKSKILHWNQDGLDIRLVAGSAYGRNAPLKGYSSMFMIDVYAEESGTLDLAGQIKGEVAFVIVSGSIEENGEHVHVGQMLVSKTEDQCRVRLAANTRLLLFGGEPLQQEHFLLWNFVSHSKEKLQEAKSRWISKTFPRVPGDDTYIEFPERIG